MRSVQVSSMILVRTFYLLNSNDIESITGHQGCRAASLYGSRAANGAVVITTKSGKKVQDAC